MLKHFLAIGLFCINIAVHAQYKVGDIVESFELKSTNGSVVSLEDMDSEGVVVVFTCNTCPYAVMYEDRLIALHLKYASKGYPVLAINPNDPTVKEGDSFEAMQARSEEKSFPYEYLFDAGQKVYPKFGATKTPEAYLLDKDRKVRYVGAIDDNAQSESSVKETYLSDAIDALIEGREPAVTQTKAIGCTIKVAR